MKITEAGLGVLLFEPKAYGDDRGYFMETWRKEVYAEAGIKAEFVQDNISFSKKGVLRGLHYQHPQGQGKLVQVLSGRVYDAAVDIRRGSATFGKWVGVELSAEGHEQLYIPAGFAHGFCVLSEAAMFSYKCTDYYNGATEGGIIWNDPNVGIEWPIDGPSVSDKDAGLGLLRDVPAEKLPAMESET